MVRKVIFLIVLALIHPASLTFAVSSSIPAEAGKPAKNAEAVIDTRLHCTGTAGEENKLRMDAGEALPFPPGAFLAAEKCTGEIQRQKKSSSEQEKNLKELEKERALKNLSLLLSVIYYQQKNLVGVYQGTDKAYHELLEKNIPDLQAYDQTVLNYEAALENYGGYQAFLSALPQAVADYETRVGSKLKDFAVQSEDGAITLMKAPSLANVAMFPYELNLQAQDSSLNAQKTAGKKNKKSKVRKDEEAPRDLCGFMGAFAGTVAAENIILVTLSNPLGAAIGASLGATLCSEQFYKKMTLLPTKLERVFSMPLVDLGAYIKDGLNDIGEGLYRMGHEYLHERPARTAEKIAEHYEHTRSWLMQKLGWQ